MNYEQTSPPQRSPSPPVLFIGDSVTAMGYRLAGAAVLSPPVERAPAVLDHAVSEGVRVVLLSAEYATELGPRELGELLARETPLVLIVPDARGRVARYDVAALVRSALGSEL